MKKLDETQIDKLYKFTRRHYVEYYDVQTELVDHLASGIEAQWQQNPDVPFKEALEQEFSKFGVYGFLDIVEKRERAMEKKYLRIIWSKSKTVLKQPKIILSLLLLFWISKLLLNFEQTKYYFLIFFFVSVCITLLHVDYKRKKARKIKKVYLLETMIYNTGTYFAFAWFPFQILYFSDILDSGSENFLLAFYIVFLVFISYVCIYVLPKKKEEILQKTYPERKFS